MRYDAFITYHRLSDEARAMALERALKRFAKPLFKLRALEIFRDDAALAANPSLWCAISQALDSAGHLILVASPGAASSPWVGRGGGALASPQIQRRSYDRFVGRRHPLGSLGR